MPTTIGPAVSLLGEETLGAEPLAWRSFCFSAQAGPRAPDTFLRLAGDVVDCERV